MSSQTKQQVSDAQRPSASLWIRLIVGLVSVSLLAVAAASGALYYRFKAKNAEFREQTLRNQAALITDYLKTAPQGAFELPRDVIDRFKANNGRYVIVDRSGALLAVSPGVTEEFTAANPSVSREFFVLQPNEEERPYYGLSVRTSFDGRPVWVQVAFHAGEIVFDSVLEEFIQDIAWIWIPFVVILLLVNLLVARIGLRPLRAAASQAAAIGPGSVSMRLTEEGLPRDVHALVSAVNHGLDRLETAFDAQRRFIADAAHELRTPVAVLKAHVAILSNSKAMPSLQRRSAVSNGSSINCSTWLVSMSCSSALTTSPTSAASRPRLPPISHRRPSTVAGPSRLLRPTSRFAFEARATTFFERCATSWKMPSGTRRRARRSPSWSPIHRQSAS